MKKKSTMKKSRVSAAGTYIVSIALGKLEFKKNIQIGIGGFLAATTVFGTILNIMEAKGTLKADILTVLVCSIPLILGIRNGHKASLVRRYDAIFMHDNDGTVTINELAKQTGKPTHKIIKELEYLFGKGMFRDCTLQTGGIPCVILMGREGSRTKFIEVVCENCGGVTRIRAGTTGKCEYCGKAISNFKL